MSCLLYLFCYTQPSCALHCCAQLLLLAPFLFARCHSSTHGRCSRHLPRRGYEMASPSKVAYALERRLEEQRHNEGISSMTATCCSVFLFSFLIYCLLFLLLLFPFFLFRGERDLLVLFFFFFVHGSLLVCCLVPCIFCYLAWIASLVCCSPLFTTYCLLF